ncbi:hypothetical protein EYF80_054628 [Liparis tanakae]|uniref:Uncharacterized protein n=1 Tax=Liparis tanakae TaxID=230148 RepID=A0A4Z2F237_9TELE|nr:hypothetical protein EYF80_054628 [Liparis tanakae]
MIQLRLGERPVKGVLDRSHADGSWNDHKEAGLLFPGQPEELPPPRRRRRRPPGWPVYAAVTPDRTANGHNVSGDD